MSGSRKAFFIINPVAGKKKFPDLNQTIESICNQAGVGSAIAFTESSGHATILAADAASQKFDTVFAVGGDGTVNETAKGLIGSESALGIIPVGSGNGLARHLGISLKPDKALKVLLNQKPVYMDTLSINGNISVNVSGIGFDGHIANLFGKGGKRGLSEYVSLTATEFRKFKNLPVTGFINDEPFISEVFILALANSSQFGNNATISPTASVHDGLIDFCIVKKVPLLQALGFAGKMFTRRMHKSAFVKILNGTKAQLNFDREVPYHIDGEGMGTAQKFSVEINPKSLQILAAASKI